MVCEKTNGGENNMEILKGFVWDVQRFASGDAIDVATEDGKTYWDLNDGVAKAATDETAENHIYLEITNTNLN